MTKWIFAVGASLLCCVAYADSVQTPVFKVADTWVYAITTENGQTGWTQKQQQISIERINHQDMLVTLNQKGSNQPPVEVLRGLDWSRTGDVNGKQQIISQPLSFPLSEGKKWELSVKKSNPTPKLTSASFDCNYAVTGWEEVQVPAGKFNALKVECNGEWKDELAAGVNFANAGSTTQSGSATVTQSQTVMQRTVSGRIYQAYWYVPSIKRYVKSLEESYTSQGTRSSRITEELISFTPGT